jgi:hypothetical protein
MTRRSLQVYAGLTILIAGTAVGAHSVLSESPTLDGTRVTAESPLFEITYGPSDPAGCDPTASSSMSFSGFGEIREGPFSGSTMTYSGVVTLGTQEFTTQPLTGPWPSDQYGFAANYGAVSNITGSFTISGRNVAGTFTGLVPGSPGGMGSCYGVGAGPNFGYDNLDSGAILATTSYVSYTATIDGSPTSGGIFFNQRQTCYTGNLVGTGCGYGYFPVLSFYTPPPTTTTQPPTTTTQPPADQRRKMTARRVDGSASAHSATRATV